VDERRGLQGDEQCPGCDVRDGRWEECDVYKQGMGGKGSDGSQGR
jgi:hypothetical protein